MKKAVTAWVWSLSVLTRSAWALLAMTAVITLWAFAAYEWLGLPESSVLLLFVALVWLLLQVLVAVGAIAGSASGAVELAASEGTRLPMVSLWPRNPQSFLRTLLWAPAGAFLVLLLRWILDFVNSYSIEVASFLTFHLQKPVSHLLLEQVYGIIEALLWTGLTGFLLSLLMLFLRGGWSVAGHQTGTLLAQCCVGAPFLTSLVSIGAFAGAAYGLTVWHPTVPVGFWDYTQVAARFSLAVFLLSAGWLFWLLSLARLHIPPDAPSPHPETIPAFLP